MGENGTLYVVATPIGNLGDLSPRAVEVLQRVSVVAAEDTRTTSVLFHNRDIHTKCVSYHKFNERSRIDYFLDLLSSGQDVAIVSDAGTPCINDPGQILVSEAVKNGFRVMGIPGACAAVTVLMVSGFFFRSFGFFGFFPRQKAEIDALFAAWSSPSRADAAVCYESPKRIHGAMALLAKAFPDASICLCNDLTKHYERVYRGTPSQVLEELNGNPDAEKGEYAFAIRFPDTEELPALNGESGPVTLEARLIDCMIKESCTAKDAVSILTEQLSGSVSKKELYKAGLRLKGLFE